MMAGLFGECMDLFGTDDLYSVLGIDKKSNDKQVKRAYHRMSLAVHPDRVDAAEKDICTKKFQALSKVYTILSNSETRKVYDETGEIDEESNLQEDKDWYQYWRLLFAKISVADIKEFEEKYKGSDEELEDLKAAYKSCKGDMDEILDTVMCAHVDDVPRFTKILKNLIKAGDLKSYKAFEKYSTKKLNAKKAKAAEEAEEAERMKKEMGLGEGTEGLEQMILKNRKTREAQANDFFAELEARYGGQEQPQKKKSKRK